MADMAQVSQALLDEIAKKLEEGQPPLGVLYLAEAYAWVINPNQSHGGPSSS